MPHTETSRLRLRNLVLEDAPFILELVNTPGWLQYVGDRGIRTEEDARVYILSGPLHSYMTTGFGFQLVELRECRTPIGLCGLVKRAELEHADLGYALLPTYYGQGYAFEAAESMLNSSRMDYNMATVLAITNKDNDASIHLLEKLGFTRLGETILHNETEPLYLFQSPVWPN
ncbi:MAG: GNAT family N-acetyltransferase [Bacteroidota bacterium]